MGKIWENSKASMQKTLGPEGFNLWIHPLRAREVGNGEIILDCPDPFFQEWISQNYLGTIRREVSRVAGRDLKVSLGVKAESAEKRRAEIRQMVLPQIEARISQSIIINRRFTFDQFVVGSGNCFAYQAAWAVANGTGRAYNPLYFYGESGVGKSHLSSAIGNHIHERMPTATVFYVSAEEFVNEMISALRKADMCGFKEKYRNRCDVLLIDGIHFFSGKEKTQAELSHTLDHLYNQGKQIILTSNAPPHQLSDSADGLKSRLGCGLVVDIQPPDLETRQKILRLKAKAEGKELPEDVVEFLAARISGSVRKLEGLVINLIAKSSLLFRPVDLKLAEEVFTSFYAAEEESHEISIPAIQELVAAQYHMTVEELTSRSRRKSVCFPRQVAIYLCRKLTNQSLDEIGKFFCRDHASVIHSIVVIEKLIHEKAAARREVDFLLEKIRGINPTACL